MEQITVTAICVLAFASPTLAQSLTIENRVELTVAKVERLTKWQPGGSGPPVEATPGKEFVKLHLTARFLPSGPGDFCDTRAGDYELVDVNGGKVLGMTIDLVLEPDTEWKRRCRTFAVEFQESPAGVALAKLRLKGSETDISKVLGASRGKK